MDKQGVVSRRDFFSTLLKDAMKTVAGFKKECGEKDGITLAMEGFENLPIASTYPWELFEDEAKRLGIDYQKLGKVEAIKRIIAHQLRQNPPDCKSDATDKTPEVLLRIDPVTEIHAIFDSIFRIIIPSDSARSFFKIKGISEKLAGDPGWYLWFEDRPGAYLLELVEAGSPQRFTAEENGYTLKNCFSGHFQIKYFPDVCDTGLLEKFSFSEQIVRDSDFFNDTGTPTFEASLTINDTLFLVGNLDVLQSPDKEFTEFFLSAPDHWVTRHLEGFEMIDKSGSNAVIMAPGETDRDTPAWELSWYLLDKLITIFCNVNKTVPVCTAIFEKEGKSFEIDGNKIVSEKPEPTIKEFGLIAALTAADKACEAVFDTDECATQLKGHDFPTEVLLAGMQKGMPTTDRDWINSHWWHAHHIDVSLEDAVPC
ncbi:MAG: hypothetical protein NTX75_07130 [Proteobacteria bacterium]|nr:hypothetical protein [Pseudomonadota bacterium]